MNADPERLYIWAAENGLCLNPEKSQAIVIGFPGFHAAADQPVSMRSATIPFCTRVKSLGLTINSRFAWEVQINIVCRRVYFTLKRLWTTASLTPVGTRLQLVRSLVVPFFVFLYCDVIFSKVAVGLRDRLRLAYNSCTRYFFGIRRSEHLSGYSARILGLPLGRYYSFRICCQMYRIVSTRKNDNLYRKLQFGRSARLSNLIFRRITMPRRRPSSLYGRQSGASLVRRGLKVDAVRLLKKLLSLKFCDVPLRRRRTLKNTEQQTMIRSTIDRIRSINQ
jgi:hypothetical protein